MRILCLGWGSLIWNPGSLPIKGDWETDGPALPIEFARQSSDGRLTLVVAQRCLDVEVLWAELDVHTIEDAKSSLAEREGISDKNIKYSIGHWTQEGRSRHLEASIIDPWAKTKFVDGVVWTGLKPGFKDNRGHVPTLEDTLNYLRELECEASKRAEEYVRRTPHQITTQYRDAYEREFGWVPISN
ncbi:MAG: hypothetical protein KZQ98_20125 [Candidatus Thiodiazotropha sp. (ex Lucinoma borealis)]|nr:hypothetical protein [Candidatus Thiodiazotropha sp. (ex Lucinoma borealis)]